MHVASMLAYHSLHQVTDAIFVSVTLFIAFLKANARQGKTGACLPPVFEGQGRGNKRLLLLADGGAANDGA